MKIRVTLFDITHVYKVFRKKNIAASLYPRPCGEQMLRDTPRNHFRAPSTDFHLRIAALYGDLKPMRYQFGAHASRA